ncbi:MAG: choline-glycine betaine transporter [Bacillariaceae sp.]|jgi:choline-glycine betaine transporter
MFLFFQHNIMKEVLIISLTVFIIIIHYTSDMRTKESFHATLNSFRSVATSILQWYEIILVILFVLLVLLV